MVRKLFEEQKRLIFFLAGTLLLILLMVSAWMLFSLMDEVSPEEPVEPPMVFGYCGAEPKELCVLSFGRDANGNSIISFFVPDRDFPDFYLDIRRFDDVLVYACQRNEEMPTSVVCMGDAIHLNERVEINLMSTDDPRLLARGIFTLKAILILSQAWNPQTFQLEHLTPGSATPSVPSRTPTPGATGTALRITPTATVSYPSYP